MSEVEKHSNPRDWYSTNLVGIPAWLLASTEFNEHPHVLRIAGRKRNSSGFIQIAGRGGESPGLRREIQALFRYRF